MSGLSTVPAIGQSIYQILLVVPIPVDTVKGVEPHPPLLHLLQGCSECIGRLTRALNEQALDGFSAFRVRFSNGE